MCPIAMTLLYSTTWHDTFWWDQTKAINVATLYWRMLERSAKSTKDFVNCFVQITLRRSTRATLLTLFNKSKHSMKFCLLSINDTFHFLIIPTLPQNMNAFSNQLLWQIISTFVKHRRRWQLFTVPVLLLFFYGGSITFSWFSFQMFTFDITLKRKCLILSILSSLNFFIFNVQSLLSE